MYQLRSKCPPKVKNLLRKLRNTFLVHILGYLILRRDGRVVEEAVCSVLYTGDCPRDIVPRYHHATVVQSINGLKRSLIVGQQDFFSFFFLSTLSISV